MSVHRIRLRGPWLYEWLTQPTPETKAGRVSLPKEWREVFGPIAGQVRFRRTFHCPTNLKEAEGVDLVLEGLGGEVDVTLNGRVLEPTLLKENQSESVRFEIGNDLLPTNDLQVTVAYQPQESPQPGGLWGLVVLEIRE